MTQVRRLPPPGELSQRQLALALRYAIDVARQKPSDRSRKKVKELIEGSPTNVRSKHVEHNLGSERIEWLRKRPSLGWKEN